MSLSVFLIFPDDDTKILSLCESCETLIAFLSDISSILSKASKTIKFYYDSQNIELFSQKIKVLFPENTKLDCTLRLVLAPTSQNVQEEARKLDVESVYLHYSFASLSIQYAPNILVEIAEREYLYQEHLNLLVNLQDAIDGVRNGKFFVFKDSIHGYPENIVPICCVSNFHNFETWLDDNYNPDFSLRDTDRFEPVSRWVKGMVVYKDKTSSQYWHLDSLHKNEYEVYDEHGRHCGVSNLKGDLDTSKAVARRKIDIN